MALRAGKVNENHQSGIGCFERETNISAVRIIEFVGDKISYIQDVSKMLGETSGVGSPHQNKEKVSYQCMTANGL
jgi:hypothetical protein